MTLRASDSFRKNDVELNVLKNIFSQSEWQK